VVGLAAATIVLWLIFFIRRRRRTRRLEHDTAVSATLAAAGFNRSPLHDDDDESRPGRRSPGSSSRLDMAQRRSSSQLGFPSVRSHPVGTGGTMPPYADPFATPGQMHDDFNPYGAPGVMMRGPSREGYVPAPTSSPPPSAGLPPSAYRDATHRSGSDRASSHSQGHGTTTSMGSYEPLLGAAGLGTSGAAAAATGGAAQGHHSPSPPLSPKRSPEMMHAISTSDGYFPAGGTSPPIPPRSPMRTAPSLGSGNGLTDAAALRRRASSVYSDEDDVGTVHELPESRLRLEVRNADGTLSRASSMVSHK
jgi:hypothetical protein